MKCKEMVTPPGMAFPRPRPCKKEAQNGSEYCRQHDPIKAAQRQDAAAEFMNRAASKHRMEIAGPMLYAILQRIANGECVDPVKAAADAIAPFSR